MSSSTGFSTTEKDMDSREYDSSQALESFEVSTVELGSDQSYLPDQTAPRKFKTQTADIKWSGVAWICAKQLKHYPAFRKDGTTIAVHTFVFIMAVERNNYLGYLEDMYEDKKGRKKVKMRWFHHNEEVKGLLSEMNPHPREVLITPHVQVISAECVAEPATVLTPVHYEKFAPLVAQSSSSGIYMCFRQFKDNRIKPFALSKLRGYSNQAILTSDVHLDYKKGANRHWLYEEEKEVKQDIAENGPLGMRTKKGRCSDGLEMFSFTAENQVSGGNALYPNLKFRLSRNTKGCKFAGSQSEWPVPLQANEKAELLCQDSGIRGCWFRCTILRTTVNQLEVQYDDLEDAEEAGNLKEWIPASRVAAPDKLGIRRPGRCTIRPQPPEKLSDCNIAVGAVVDVWLDDGWWEAIVTGIDSPGKDTLQVYCTGEERLLTVQRKDARISRDWVDNRWVEIPARPDIVCHLSRTMKPSMGIGLCYGGAEEAASESKSQTSVKHETGQSEKPEALRVPAPGNLLVNLGDEEKGEKLSADDGVNGDYDVDVGRKTTVTEGSDST